MKTKMFLISAAAITLAIAVAAPAQARPYRSYGRGHRSSEYQPSGDKPDGYVGVYGNMLFFPDKFDTGSGISDHSWQDFSGGLSVVVEGYVSRFFAIGGMFDLTFIDDPGGSDVNDDWPQVSLDLSMRPLIPFGSKGQFEVYLRVAVGYTAFIPSRNALDVWQDLDDTRNGWNLRLLPGFSFRASFGLTFSVELGWVGSGYPTANAGLDHVMYHSPALNIGVGYTF